MTTIPADRLAQVLKRFEMLEAQMAAGVEPDAYVKMAGEYADLEPLARKVRDLIAAREELQGLDALLADRSTDQEMRDLAEMEVPELEERIEALTGEIQLLLLPRDAADEKSAVLEIRAGTGGSEAALFAGDLFRMYERYASDKGWKVEVLCEPRDHERVTLRAALRLLDRFRPDLVFAIDHHRSSFPALPASIPFVCWIQDDLEALTSPAAARALRCPAPAS